jgi:ribosomal protein S20
MGRISLVRRVEAELLKHQVNLNYITVKAPEVDKVIVSGLVSSETAKNDVSRLVQKVAGKAVKVENLLSLLPMGH